MIHLGPSDHTPLVIDIDSSMQAGLRQIRGLQLACGTSDEAKSTMPLSFSYLFFPHS